MTSVIARNNVTVRSRAEDEQHRLKRRLQFTGEKELIYNVRESEINVVGPGTLVSEDYRPPAKRDSTRQRSEEDMANLERPMQTLFQWKESMEMSQLQRQVVLTGDVMMVNRSGSRIMLLVGKRPS